MKGTFPFSSFFFLAVLSASGCGRAAPPPNVVLVVIDTLRADHCSAYGYVRETTPHLDALAAEGVLFEHAWSQAPWTLPSMVSLLTGRYVLANYMTLPADTRTLAERLKEGGYSTAGLAANPILLEESGFGRGFDCYRVAGTFHDDSTLPADPFAEEAETILKEKVREPFFVWFHLIDPHEPYRPPSALSRRMSRPRPGVTLEGYRARQPPYAKKEMDREDMEKLEDLIRRYDGEVAYADRALGRIVATLRALGLLERTLVVVASDHGQGLFEHAEHVRRDGGLRNLYGLYEGHGEHVYEEALHVPLVIRGPGFEGGKRFSGLVENVDLFPTLLAAAGLPRDPGAAGRDLARLPAQGKKVVFAFSKRNHAVRTAEGYKLIHPARMAGEKGRTVKRYLLADHHRLRRPELFDLKKDPAEQNPLSLEQRSDTFQTLRNLLLRWQEGNMNALGDAAPSSLEMDRRLRVLGYVR